MIEINNSQYNVPGVLLSVAENGGSITHYQAGLSDISANTPVNPSQLVQCGQITRLFTMGILLRLVDEGAFKLDSPLEWVARQHQQDAGLLAIIVSQYPFLKPITVRELLGNTSGLPAFDKTMAYREIFAAKPRKVWQLENYLDAISGVDVRYLRGYKASSRAYYQDSATDYLIAGFVIEAVCGMPTSLVMRDTFREFNLKNTVYLPYGVKSDEIVARMMRGYLPTSHPFAQTFAKSPRLNYNNNRELTVLDVTNSYTVNGMGNAAVVSTNEDMIRWLDQLLQVKVVTANFKTMMDAVAVRDSSVDGEDHYCLGLCKSIIKPYGEIIWAAGNSLGYAVLLAHSLSKNITFALQVNVSRHHYTIYTEGLVSDVLHQLL